MPTRERQMCRLALIPIASAMLLASSSSMLAGCHHTRGKASIGELAREETAGTASPDFKQERMLQARRGLLYDSGLVEIDPALASELTGGRNAQAAAAEYEEGQRMLYEVNDRVGAIAAFTRAVLLDPDAVEHYTGLGRAWLFKGNMAESLASFRTALLLSPEDFDAQLGFAEAMQMGGGGYDDAIIAWQRVLALDPSYDEAHVRLATLLYYTGDYAKSWEHVHQAEAMGVAVPPQFRPLLASRMAEPQR